MEPDRPENYGVARRPQAMAVGDGLALKSVHKYLHELCAEHDQSIHTYSQKTGIAAVTHLFLSTTTIPWHGS